jgi:hypothetical protein
MTFSLETQDLSLSLEDTLIGTEWFWSSSWGDSFLVFMTDSTSINGSYTDWYTYNPQKRTGMVEYMGPFVISEDGLHLTFTNYGGYGHTGDFVRR